MVVGTAKKTTTKAPTKAGGTASKGHAVPSHPTWVDMIKECIVAHPEDARGGVSRPTIKKFVESKYHIDLSAAAASQLNRAITHGAEKGTFVLPKGPSGKVKLAPKVRSDAAKENAPTSKASAKPSSKKSTAPAAKPAKSSTLKKTPATKPKANVAATTPASKANRSTTKSAPSTKKYTSVAKKAKSSSITTKKPSAKKPSPKKSTSKKAAAKTAATGYSAAAKVATAKKAAAAKSASKSVKPTRSRVLSSKAKEKPASKTSPKKPASKKA